MIGVDHGLEYHVEFDKSFDYYPALSKYISHHKKQVYWGAGVIVIAGTHATDDRLLVSKYYKDRKDSWFNVIPGKSSIDKGIIDMTLSDSEKEYLKYILDEFGEAVISHGWYDVVVFR